MDGRCLIVIGYHWNSNRVKYHQMAVFTHLAEKDAQRIADACNLGRVHAVEPVPAGSVNSNFYLDTHAGRVFVRIYEEQGAEGVRYEWALLRFLLTHGVCVAGPLPGLSPDELQVQGKPVGVFECVGGSQSCQQGVTRERAAAVGAWLANVHGVLQAFPEKRQGRFTVAHMKARLHDIATRSETALVSTVTRLEENLGEIESFVDEGLPHGVIHGDLFRDNVRWDGCHIVSVIDWESASDGLFIYDLMVAVLAWCYGNGFDWQLVSAMVRSYHDTRPLCPEEQQQLRACALRAALRFAITRITDFHSRGSIGERVHKDYRRFLARWDAIQALDAQQFEFLCYGSGSK
ncbi:MAG: homoserine kinase [Myxococcales bacterium]|nr:homoserine kinase [Myxococcales bacterium]MCB9708570.1 homoserine kinase [Myxococcales bacterium]